MRLQPLRLALLIGLCVAVAAGCSHLKRNGSTGSFGSKQPTAKGLSFASSDSAAQAYKASADTDTAPGPPKTSTLDGEFAMARLCERQGETAQAERIYRILLEKTPRDARLHHRLAVMAVQRSEFATAEKNFQAAQSVAPPTAELLSDVGYCYYLQHRLSEAEATLKEAIKLEPNCALAANNLGLVFGAQGRFRESVKMFRRNSSEAEAYANLAYVLAQRGELARAEQAYLRALTLDNSMRAAAQAALQVNKRARTLTRLASNTAAPAGETDPASELAAGPSNVEGAVVLLPPPPEIQRGQEPQSVDPIAVAMPSEPPSTEVFIEAAADSTRASLYTENVPGDSDNRSN